ncbi:MAG: hypothetical protein OXM87_10540 [Truepera sp.]|nr:hypothetical protein [Truepera sp.]
MSQQPNDSENRPDRPRWLGFAQLALVIAVIAIALYFARAPVRVERGVVADLASEAGQPAVRVIHPTRTEQALTVKLTGSVRLKERVRVMSEVVGRVAWVSPEFTNGGSIAANETFIRVDPTEFELQVEAAEIAVQEAEARVWAERARGEEDARAFSREFPGVEPSEWVRRLPSIAQAEAELMKAQAELRLAELRLARTNISFPYDSRVISSNIGVGELVGPVEQVEPSPFLGIVYRTDALQVDAPIGLKDLEDLDPVIGRSARVHTGMDTYEAEVEGVSSIVAPQSRLASLFLKFSGDLPPDLLPLPGTFVEVEVMGPSYEDVYVLPESVLQERDSVWVVSDGVLTSFVPRTVGHTAAGWIVEAFDAGEGVVVGTLPRVREGLAVVATDADPSE